MAEPFLGEIRSFSFTYAPTGWAVCAGQLLPINQNQALFALLGTAFGGDGVSTFGLPDLRGRTPVHVGNGVAQGQKAGEEAHVLTPAEMPMHTHTAIAGTGGEVIGTPQGNTWGTTANTNLYETSANGTMAASAIGASGSSQAHNNMQPYRVMNYCIALAGIFPTRN